MAEGISITAEAVVDASALSTLHFKARAMLGRRLAELGERYAVDVSASGIQEAGIKRRTGAMADSIKTVNRTTPAKMQAFVYPTAKDPDTGYGYAYALGLGSPRNQVDVKAYVRGSGGRNLSTFREFVRRQDAKGRRRRRAARFYTYDKLYGRMTPQRRSEIVEVKAHHRGVNLKARPFMGGSAWSRLQSTFDQEMREAMAEAINLSMHETAADAAAEAEGYEGMGGS